VLTKGDVQLFSGVPVNAADGGAVTVMAPVNVVSTKHPQLFFSTILGENTPFTPYVLQGYGLGGYGGTVNISKGCEFTQSIVKLSMAQFAPGIEASIQ
jgi:hypothetical protein